MRNRLVRFVVGVAVLGLGMAALQSTGSGQTAKPTDVITANRYSITIARWAQRAGAAH